MIRQLMCLNRTDTKSAMEAKGEFVLYDAGSEHAQACWLPNPWKSQFNCRCAQAARLTAS
jgi:hypothetical protein